jgi:alcohol dehydrogenase YqhD (iron-dependent ADH family)
MEGIMRTCVKYGKQAIDHPDDYDARANLMWASSWAINGMIACGKAGPWVCHPIEHQLSAFYDVTHGMGLAVIIPHWMRKILDDTIVDVFVDYGVNVFGIDKSLPKYEIANQAIDQTSQWFDSMGIPKNLRELGITEKDKFEIMAEKESKGWTKLHPLSKEDILDIWRAAY